MKIDKKKQLMQRQVIDKKVSRLAKHSEPPPPSGWLKAIRGSLGMTAKQLSLRLGTSAASVIQLEEREPTKKVTLESLEKAAQAMGCKLVYAIVPGEPNRSLEDILERQADEAASRILREVSHSMRLESQIERLSAELRMKGDSQIWDLPTPKKARK
jgi:predicted DNA-binding mobile mystery protein A